MSSLGTTEGGHLVGARLSDRLSESILLAGVEGAGETWRSGGRCEDGKVIEHPNSSSWRRRAVPRYAGPIYNSPMSSWLRVVCALAPRTRLLNIPPAYLTRYLQAQAFQTGKVHWYMPFTGMRTLQAQRLVSEVERITFHTPLTAPRRRVDTA